MVLLVRKDIWDTFSFYLAFNSMLLELVKISELNRSSELIRSLANQYIKIYIYYAA